MSFVLIFFLLQPPVEFGKLREIRRHRIQRGYFLCGLCYDDNKLYCVEWHKGDIYSLTVYDIAGAGNGNLRLLDSVEVESVSMDCRPRIDTRTQWVYVPCAGAGVDVFRWEDNRLRPVRMPLMCVEGTASLAVNTADTVFVCARESSSVCLVSVSEDTVIRLLKAPVHLPYYPNHVSVLGETVLVCYGDNTLVAYQRHSPTSGRILETPEGLEKVTSITTDSHSSFLVTDWSRGDSVFVLGDRGDLRHKIPRGEGLWDCAVVQSELWLGGYTEYIAVMTSQ